VLCDALSRVYFHKTGDSDTDYLVDHSIIMYLIDPAGDFVTFYGERNRGGKYGSK
jgi:protein SCO1/2